MSKAKLPQTPTEVLLKPSVLLKLCSLRSFIQKTVKMLVAEIANKQMWLIKVATFHTSVGSLHVSHKSNKKIAHNLKRLDVTCRHQHTFRNWFIIGCWRKLVKYEQNIYVSHTSSRVVAGPSPEQRINFLPRINLAGKDNWCCFRRVDSTGGNAITMFIKLIAWFRASSRVVSAIFKKHTLPLVLFTRLGWSIWAETLLGPHLSFSSHTHHFKHMSHHSFEW